MKKSKLPGLSLMALGLMLVCAPAQAESDWEISGNVGITSDYVFRGFTQTNEDFAIQGGLDLAHSSGFYAGAWASNLEFLDGDVDAITGGLTNSTSLELDLYAGFAGDFGNSIFSYDATAIFYGYPGDVAGSDYDYWEFGATVSADAGFATVSVGALYSPDFFGGIGDAIYIPVGIDVPIPMGNAGPFALSVSGELGWNKYFDVAGDDDYVNWNLGLTIAIEDWFDVDVRYHDTDLSDIDCDKLCDERFVVSISRSL